MTTPPAPDALAALELIRDCASQEQNKIEGQDFIGGAIFVAIVIAVLAYLAARDWNDQEDAGDSVAPPDPDSVHFNVEHPDGSVTDYGLRRKRK